MGSVRMTSLRSHLRLGRCRSGEEVESVPDAKCQQQGTLRDRIP
jgi:hypothetical protein